MASKLLAQISKLAPYQRKTWISHLSASQRAELLELKQAFLSGALKDSSGSAPSTASIWRLVKKELKLGVCIRSFSDWLTSDESSK